MFSQNQEEVKLEWMYKGPHSTVDREEYLLGRSVDKTLEQINSEEKQQLGISQPKNHVEHECIPPSIREYKLQCGDQVDISTKLQEDPLIAIKKQEEEKRRQFLNNPVQIKKLQKALKAQKKSKNCISDLDEKLVSKLRLLKGGGNVLEHKKTKKLKGASLDTILMHKYNLLKSKLSDTDLHDIFEGKVNSSSSSSGSDSNSSSSNSSDEEEDYKHSKKHRKRKSEKKNSHTEYKSRKRDSRDRSKFKQSMRDKNVSCNSITKIAKHKNRSNSNEHITDKITKSKYEYRDSKSNATSGISSKRQRSCSNSSSASGGTPPKKHWGLVRADGTRIPHSQLSSEKSTSIKSQPKATAQASSNQPQNRHRQCLTENEKEKRRQEMLVNASWREKERSKNLEAHRKKLLIEDNEKKSFDPQFLQRELLKAANSGTVESRIKANINNIQRSGSDMNKHFSRR